MNDQFKVGTICIGQNFVYSLRYNGMSCEIIGDLEVRRTYWVHGVITTEPCYRVRWADGTENNTLPSRLRLPPPKHKEWADEAIRKLKKQSSDHVVIGKPELIPEEA